MSESPNHLSRRQLMGTATAVALGATALGGSAKAQVPRAQSPQATTTGKAVKNGRIKQSIVQWCFAPHWDVPQLIKVAKGLGCGSIELLEPKYFPMLKDAGLE